MEKKGSSVIYRGIINKEFSVTFNYTFTDQGQYQPIQQKGDTLKIYPSFILNLSEGYGKAYLGVMSNIYHPFIAILEKAVKMISENLYDIFPDVSKLEFEVDPKTLQIYQTEKAMSTGGITIVPAVWVDNTQQCFPAIKVTTLKYPTGITIPLEDAIAMNKMFNTFDPHTYSMILLQLMN